jgi:hypothetical protein
LAAERDRSEPFQLFAPSLDRLKEQIDFGFCSLLVTEVASLSIIRAKQFV